VAGVCGILVAAGSGERLGLSDPKAFALLAGQPLLVHAARALEAAVDELVVVIAPGRVAQATSVLEAAGIAHHTVCEGGATRSDSVRCGLVAATRETVLVHDAARPLATGRLARRTLHALDMGWDAVAPGLPVVDTLKVVAAGGAGHAEAGPAVHAVRVHSTPDRSTLWAVQTPQAFRGEWLRMAHASGAHATDDLALVERAGGRVALVPGERTNMKVTFPEDLAAAEALVAWPR